MLQVSPDDVVTWAKVYAAVVTVIVTTATTLFAVWRWLIKPVQKEIQEERKDRLEDRKHIDDIIARHATRIQSFEGEVLKIVELTIKMDVLWPRAKEGLAGLLHRDDTPDLDTYLEKVQNGTATLEDYDVISRELERIEKGEAQRSKDDKFAARFLRGMLDAERRARTIKDRLLRPQNSSADDG